MARTTPLTHALKLLKVMQPEYFKYGPGRIPALRYPFQRPNLLTEATFGDVPLRLIAAPTGMVDVSVLTWKEWFDEIVAENLDDSPPELRALVEDLACRAHLNARQLKRFMPRHVVASVQAINAILCFCLQGAVLSGAQIMDLSQDTFSLLADNGEWGIRSNRVLHTDHNLSYPLPYQAVVQGTAWKGGGSSNGNLVRAYHSAQKANDIAAMEVINAAFWNIPEGSRIDALFTL